MRTELISVIYRSFHPFAILFERLFFSRDYKALERHKDTCVLLLHGGEDISPSLYNDKTLKVTHADKNPSLRDQIEQAHFLEAVRLNIPIIGICRGAQLACALSGGKLIQHADGHAGGHHDIEFADGSVIETTSAHHQMMYPFEIDHEIIAKSAEIRSTVHIRAVQGRQVDTPVEVEPEIVWFPKTKSLAIQGHPEWMNPETPFVKRCLELVNERILGAANADQPA